jgi:hypothetical protein
MIMSFRGACGDEKSARLCLIKDVSRRFLASLLMNNLFFAVRVILFIKDYGLLEMTKNLVIYLTVYCLARRGFNFH